MADLTEAELSALAAACEPQEVDPDYSEYVCRKCGVEYYLDEPDIQEPSACCDCCTYELVEEMPRVIEMARRSLALEAEKAEREAIERRRDEWLGTGSKYGIKRRWIEQCQTESGFLIALCSHEAMKYFRDIGEGPTYHEALAEALGRVGA